jgi:4-hydroxybenzoate polyprenyltransferase
MMLVLFWRMLRYRVAVMLWMFMLLGTGLSELRLDYVWAGLVLACCYVTATCFNDVADQAVDRINHPRDNGRPLVSGDASPHQLLVLGSVSAALAVLFAVPLGWPGVVLALVSLLVGHGYSLRPARISYRAWYLAAPVLSIGYVVVPFLLGVFASGRTVSWHDVGFCAGLYLLFVARINLKDFRDRDGDAAYGKPTLLLRYGKTATCVVSAVALLAADVVLLLVLRPYWFVGLAFQVYVGAAAAMLVALWRAGDRRDEQIAIGIGARMGNGLLICILAVQALEHHAASTSDLLIVTGGLTAAFALSFATLVIRPDEVEIGYKG